MTDQIEEQFPLRGLPTLEEHRARRGAAPPVGVHARTTRLTPGDLEEIEAAAQRDMGADPGQVLGLMEVIAGLSRRVAARFNEAADAKAEAAEYAAQVRDLKTALNENGSRAHVCVDRCRPNQHVAFEGRALVDRLETSIRELREGLDAKQSALDTMADNLRLSQGQVRDLQDEVASRYTKEQVANLQASEAELVAAPLRRRIGDLEQSLAARDRMLAEATRVISQVADAVFQPAVGESMGVRPDTVYAARLAQALRSVRTHLSSSSFPVAAFKDSPEGPTGPTSPTD